MSQEIQESIKETYHRSILRKNAILKDYAKKIEALITERNGVIASCDDQRDDELARFLEPYPDKVQLLCKVLAENKKLETELYELTHKFPLNE